MKARIQEMRDRLKALRAQEKADLGEKVRTLHYLAGELLHVVDGLGKKRGDDLLAKRTGELLDATLLLLYLGLESVERLVGVSEAPPHPEEY